MNRRKISILIIGVTVILLSSINVSAEFGTDIRVNDDTGDEGQIIGPEKTAVVMKDNVVYAVWQDFRNVSDNLRPDIYFAKGTIDEKNNITFSDNVMVNDIPHSPLNDKPSAPAMAVGDDGIIYVVWTDMRNIDNQLEGVDVYFSRSTDGGNSFETNQLIGSTTGGSGAASIAVAGSHVYVVYEHCCDPANNVLDFVVSSDKGQSFGNLETIYIPTEGVTGSGQPTIAAEGSYVYVAFQLKTVDYEGQVALMISSDYGASFSDPKIINDDEGSNYQAAISLALSGDNVYFVWHDLREPAGVYFSASHDKGSTFGSNQIIIETGSSFPVPAISAYDENVAITYCGRSEDIYGFVVLAKISQDNGTTWSNESIVSDTDVSRSAIGPSAISVSDIGVGILFVDGRGSWEGDNIYFDWCTFDETGAGTPDDENGAETPPDDGTDEETPGFEVLTVIGALAVAFIILRRKK